MHVCIVGAGIVGVTTAYELAADGHAVTVFDRHNAAATQDSFATGGLLAPAAAIPWALPGLLAPARWLGRKAPLRLGRQLSLSDLSWLRHCRRAAARARRPAIRAAPTATRPVRRRPAGGAWWRPGAWPATWHRQCSPSA